MVLLVLFLMGFFLLHFNGFLTLGFYLLAFFIRLCSHGRLGWLYCVSSSCMVLVWAFLLVFTVLTIVTSFRMFRVVAFIGRTVCTSLHGPNRDTFIACVLSHGRLCWSHCVFSFVCPLAFLFHASYRTVAFVGCTVSSSCMVLVWTLPLVFTILTMVSSFLWAWSPLLVVLCASSCMVLFGYFYYMRLVTRSPLLVVLCVFSLVCVLCSLFAWSPLLVVLCASFCMVLIWRFLSHASCRTVAFVGCTVCVFVLISVSLASFNCLFYLVGEVGFDSLAKLAGRPRMRVPPLLGGSSRFSFFCL